jgi:leucyl-tRNA synthetase
MPHYASECLEDLNDNNDINWPIAEKKFLSSESVNIVIQINGKKKSLINVTKNLEEEKVILEIKKNKLIKKLIENKKINRIIYVKNRLINFLI